MPVSVEVDGTVTLGVVSPEISVVMSVVISVGVPVGGFSPLQALQAVKIRQSITKNIMPETSLIFISSTSLQI
jgi:hypothetical protein